MSVPTVARYCCGHVMELQRRYPDGNELVSCRHCGRFEEVAPSGYAVPKPPTTHKERKS